MENVFRTVISGQRNIELKEPYVVINENISPKLYEYLATMNDIKFEDGAYHSFYGELKVIVNNFLVYWSDVINQCFKEVDTLCKGITKDDILAMIDRTISIHENKHAEFIKSFLPVQHPEEIKIFENLESKYENFQQSMVQFREEVVQYERQEQLDQFIIKHSEFGTRRKNEVFEYTHTIMALCMAANVSTTLIIHYHYLYKRTLTLGRQNTSIQINKIMRKANIENIEVQ